MSRSNVGLALFGAGLLVVLGLYVAVRPWYQFSEERRGIERLHRLVKTTRLRVGQGTRAAE